MLNKDLEIIKKKYGENMMKLCRSFFSSILEEEGRLLSILLSNFYPSHTLYDDLEEQNLLEDFKNFIYSLANFKKNIFKTDKTPEELLDEKGYILKECLTEEEIQEYKKYYKKGESLCTFRGNRLNSCRVFFAVKKDVLDIKREDFKDPKRQDLYGTSVISIQFTKDGTNTLSIKNRYNHRVLNPDATFSNNLDNIKEGLTYAFEKYYGIEQKVSSYYLEIPGYVRANDGKYYKYNYEINNIYYCPNNIIIDTYNVKHLASEKYIVMDYFILDLVNKEINNYDIRIFDNFANSFSKIEKIEVTKHNDFKVINLLHENNNKTVMILNKLNNLIGLYSNDLIEIKDKFLEQNKYLKEVNLPNVSKIGDDFICKNRCIKQINLPIVEVIGNRFLNNNCSLESLSLPLLVKAGHVFMTWNEVLEEVNFSSLKVAGFDFLQNNKEIKVLNLPLLEKIGDASFLMNEKLEVFNAPCLQEVGDCLLRYDENLKHVIMPSLLGIGYDVNIKIKEELDKNIKVLKR